MGKLRNIVAGVLAIIGIVAIGSQASAQIINQTHCGLASPIGGVVPTQYYDPFNPNPISNQTVTLTLDRFVGSSVSQKTQQVDFYFTQPAGSPNGFQVLYQGNNVLYTAGGGGLGVGAPTLSTSNSSPTGTIGFNFGASTNSFSPTVTISIPPGLDLSNGLTLNMNIVYACNGTGSHFDNIDPTSPGVLTNALILPVAVLNALQAYYAGPALDFGQIGSVTLAQAPSHTVSGLIHVASSGPYTVSLKSLAANPYRMTYSGGSTSTSGQYVPYSVTLLGQTKDNASPTFTTVSCTRAGVLTGTNIGISATLEDGGIGKTVAPYQDNLEVTITPLVAAPSPGSCA